MEDNKQNKHLPPTVRVGPAGWSYKDWQGIVYPVKRTREFSELEYLSRFFNTIEINSTFYRPPRIETSKKWLTKIKHNPHFEFTVKLWQKFTHERGSFSSAEITLFKDSINPLIEENRLGALLIQFPWSFKNSVESCQYVKKIAGVFNEFPIVTEFRHKSWQNPTVLKFLSENQIGFVNIDQPVIGQSITPSAEITSEIAYIRFHGRNYDNWFRQNAGRDARYDYLYSESEMAEWIKDLRELEAKAGKSYIIYNNHYQGKAVVNGFQLLAKLTNDKINVPDVLIKQYPQLGAIAVAQPTDINPTLF